MEKDGHTCIFIQSKLHQYILHTQIEGEQSISYVYCHPYSHN